MQEVFSIRKIVKESVAGRTDVTAKEIDAWAAEVEAYFGLQGGQSETLDDSMAAAAAGGDVVALGRFDRWKCYRCVAGNMALAAAIAAAVVTFGPASPGIVPWLAAKFGISETVAAAAAGGLSGGALAKKLCNVC